MKKKLLTLALLGLSVTLLAGCVSKEEVVTDETVVPAEVVEEAVEAPVVEEVMPTDEEVNVEEVVADEEGVDEPVAE